MNSKELKNELFKIANKNLPEFNAELVELEINKSDEIIHVVFYVYKENGVTIDDCADISRALGKEIEDKDLFQTNYYLEVSSPGLDRPIKTDDDLRRNKNKLVEVKLYAPLDGEKYFEGILENYTDESIILNIDENIKKIPRDKVCLMRLKIIF